MVELDADGMVRGKNSTLLIVPRYQDLSIDITPRRTNAVP